MPSLIPPDAKAIYSQVLADVHDTFKRPFYVYRTAQQVIISTSADYNYLYGADQIVSDVSYTPVSGVFEGRIWWRDPSKFSEYKDLQPNLKGNVCRVKMTQDAWEFISGCENVVIDGRPTNLKGTSRPHGLFSGDYLTAFFEETN